MADDDHRPGLARRTFLTYAVAAPVLTVATGLRGEAPGTTTAPAPGSLVLTVDAGGVVHFRLPRAELGQGLTTAVAMLVAEELDTPLPTVRVRLDDARPELLFGQFTSNSSSIRALYAPVRQTAATARMRLVVAAAQRWGVARELLATRAGAVVAPDGRSASFGSLTAAAAQVDLTGIGVTPKSEAEHTLVGTPQNRVDARAIVTGAQQYTMDLQVPDAKPTTVRRPPTLGGRVGAVENEAAVRQLPGVLDVVVIPSGVAVVAETFGQALAAKDALAVRWLPGTVDGLDDAGVRQRLRAATGPLAEPGPGVQHLDAEFDFAFVSHAPLETNCAIADVRADRATVWSAVQAPILARQRIARSLGLPDGEVTVHVPPAGGSFGRRLFFDAALEAVLISRAAGRPVKLMWSRIDDMRHGRMRPAAYHRVRATYAAIGAPSLQHHVASVRTDFRHGLGEILSSDVVSLPAGNDAFAQAYFASSVATPYAFAGVTRRLAEVPLELPTGSWRSVYSGTARVTEELVVDELAGRLGIDPVAFRRGLLRTAEQRAVLDHVAAAGEWGRAMPAGFAQGVAFHEEYRSCTACLVELDARRPRAPRVTKAVIAADVGRPVNPRGVAAQLLGGLTDAASITLRAGLHLSDGLPLEGSYSQFHYARQRDSPLEVRIHVVPGHRDPGGVGELGVPAAAGAIGNAYARATGTHPRSFPIIADIDFVPFPR
jgi:isoquinoline 1-oxidoreductase beta subunit